MRPLHSWDLAPAAAAVLQRELSSRIVRRGRLTRIRLVAGADVAFLKHPPRAVAAVLVLSYPKLEVVETQWAISTLRFPYIPGLLAFREAPALLRAFGKLRCEPDLVLIDGQGLAHPRGFGIASHIGLWLDKPTIGCAKSPLYGRFETPAVPRGSWSAILDGRSHRIGSVLRTREGTKPIFISVGHRIGLAQARRYVLDCTRGFRIPEPTRLADQIVGRIKRSQTLPQRIVQLD